jgi:hypothetical protein
VVWGATVGVLLALLLIWRRSRGKEAG